MRSILTAIIILGGMCTGVSACTASSEDEPNQETVISNEKNYAMNQEMEEVAKQCYLEMYRAMTVKDSVGMDKILDKSFVLIHMTGMRQPKAEFIRAVLDGTLNYYNAEHDEIRLLSADEEHATMVGRTRVNAAVFGGGRHTWRLQQNLRLVNRNGQWLIAEARASTY